MTTILTWVESITDRIEEKKSTDLIYLNKNLNLIKNNFILVSQEIIEETNNFKS